MNFIVIDDWLHRDENYGHTSREGKGMYETLHQWLRWEGSVVFSHSP